MSKIRWLHISDLHFDGARAKDPYDQNKVLVPLLNTAKEKKPDLIFVTGDIGKSGKKEDYDLALIFFRDLLLTTNLNSDRLWIVPGNHDVDRKIKLARTLDNELESQDFFGDPEVRKGQISKFNCFINSFLNPLFPKRQLEECDAVHHPGVIDIENFPIGILPLNSAWFSQDEKDQNQLWVGVRTIKNRVYQLENNVIKPKLFIGLLHHPSGFLHPNEASISWIRNKCQIVLRGHLHRENTEFVITPDGKSLEIIGGATYQGSDKSCHAFFTTFDTESYNVMLEPMKYKDSTASTWVPESLFSKAPYISMEYTIPKISIDVDHPLINPHTHKFDDFPFNEWTAVNGDGWMESIIEWFKQNYNKDSKKSIKFILDHIFEVINNTQNDSHMHQRIKDLGKALSNSNPTIVQEYHKNILKLLELGIQQDLPHLFMLPQVEKNNLLEVPQYSQLILASRYLSAGYCEKAKELTKSIAKGCCIASYIYGQSARKMEIFGEAKYYLESNIKILEKFYEKSCFFKHSCHFTKNFKFNCNDALIQAENYRALGVVYRKLGEKKEAEKYYKKATIAANSAIKSEKSNDSCKQQDSNIVSGTYGMMPSRVLADVYYSHGYYLYEEKNFQNAAKLFNKSIKTLENINEEWDAPYIRLGIIKLYSKNLKDMKDSYDLFSKSRIICTNTASTKNRESSLGKALCTLGLRIIEIIVSNNSLITNDAIYDLKSIDEMKPVVKEKINYNAISDLKEALQLEPPLSIGALKCHLHDVENLAKTITKNSYEGDFKIVSDFIALLNEEIETTTNKKMSCPSL